MIVPYYDKQTKLVITTLLGKKKKMMWPLNQVKTKAAGRSRKVQTKQSWLNSVLQLRKLIAKPVDFTSSGNTRLEVCST